MANQSINRNLPTSGPLSPIQQEIRSYLDRPESRGELRDRLVAIQKEVTTGISDVTKLTGMTEAQIRYSESRGLLRPKRSVSRLSTSTAPVVSQGQRRYTLDEVAQLVVIGKLLERRFALADISDFGIDAYIDEITTAQEPSHTDQLIVAETTVFQRFLVPRLLYTILWLLLENTINRSLGIYLPVRDDTDQLRSLGDLRITSVDDIGRLGQTLVGWYSPGRPFSALLQEHPSLTSFSNLKVISLDARFSNLFEEESKRAAKRGKLAHLPIGAHLVIDPALEQVLSAADDAIDLRKLRAKEARERFLAVQDGLPGVHEEPADPRLVALRLLWLMQYPFETPPENTTRSGTQTKSYPSLWHIKPESGASMVYSAFEFVSPLLGDSQLNYLLETIRQLKPDVWSFACLSLPINEQQPLHLREMRIEAQSNFSPHKIGVTTVSADPQESLVVRAYQSGQVIHRPRIVEGDTTISYRIQENAHSAIAIPVEGYRGEILGALYVASAQEDAFDVHDHLLLRIVGKLVGEVLLSYRIRHLTRSHIDAITTHPDTVDMYFEAFPSENDFIGDFEALAQGLLNAQNKTDSFKTLTLIGIDIEDQGDRINKFGVGLAHNLVVEVGKRAQTRLRSLFNEPRNMRMYRIIGDRFLIMLRNVEVEQARHYAYELRQALNGTYRLSGDSRHSAAVRIGTLTYDRRTLLSLDQGLPAISGAQTPEQIEEQTNRRAAQIRANAVRALDEALSIAKHSGHGAGVESIIAWESGAKRFIEWSQPPSTPATGVARNLSVQEQEAPQPSSAQQTMDALGVLASIPPDRLAYLLQLLRPTAPENNPAPLNGNGSKSTPPDEDS